MPRHAEQKFLPYTPAEVYDLVVDVRRYPEFLPWCVGTRVYNEKPGELTADLIIGFKMFRERFTTLDTLTPPSAGAPGHININYIKGPMKHLHNDWNFEAAVEDGVSGCRVNFTLDFEFKSRLLEKMIGGLFEEAVHRMVAAFQTRADVIYGAAKE